MCALRFSLWLLIFTMVINRIACLGDYRRIVWKNFLGIHSVTFPKIKT